MDGWDVVGGGNLHAHVHAAHTCMHVHTHTHMLNMINMTVPWWWAFTFEIIMFDMYAHVCVHGAHLYTLTTPFTHPPPTKGGPPHQ